MNKKAGCERNDALFSCTDSSRSASVDDVSIGPSSDSLSPDISLNDEALLQDLIARIVDRDQLAFSALYDLLLERVYGLVLRITRQVPFAEEVTEDTFWQIWRQAPRFDPGRGKVLAWVMTIARSRALDTLRHIAANECEENLAEREFSATDNPHDLLAAVEEGSRIHEALTKIDPGARQLVALAFFRGYSHDEIAVHTGLPLGTVKSQIRRALLSLKQILTNDADST